MVQSAGRLWNAGPCIGVRPERLRVHVRGVRSFDHWVVEALCWVELCGLECSQYEFGSKFGAPLPAVSPSTQGVQEEMSVANVLSQQSVEPLCAADPLLTNSRIVTVFIL